MYTDYNGFWHTSLTSLSSIRPDSSHNLLAFTYGGINYATGVNNDLLTENDISFVNSEYRSLPVLTLAVAPTTNTYIGVGYKYMGIANASTVVIDLDIPKYLTDGNHGLDMGTTVFNQPVSDISYKISDFNVAKIGDGVPDIVVTQMGEPSGSTDSFRFVDIYGNTVGNAVSVRLTDISPVGSAHWKFYTTTGVGAPAYHPSLNTTSIAGYRDVRLSGFDLSEFGLNAGNVDQIARFVHKLGGNSDQAFIAYNTSSFQASNNSQPGCISILPRIWLRADNLNALSNNANVNTWANTGTVNESMVAAGSATVPTYKDGTNEGFNYNSFIKTNGDGTLKIISPLPISDIDSSYTIFMVAKTSATSGNNSIMGFAKSSTDVSTNNYKFPSLGFSGTNNYLIYNSTTPFNLSGSSTDANQAGIVSLEYNQSTSAVHLMKNGSLEANGTKSPMTIGHWSAQLGGTASNVDIAEVVVYTNNLSTVEKTKIESYLAIKFGLTLGKSYMSGNNSTIWDYAANTGYNNKIVGLGREDCQRLHQKQSGSVVDPNNRLIIGLGSVANSVALNANGFTYDAHYMIFGENTGSLTTITAGYIKNQCLKYTNREWLVQRTGADIPNLNTQVKIKVSDIDFGETTGATQFLLLIDRNNNGSYNDAVDAIITSAAYSGGYAVFNNVKWNTISGSKAKFRIAIKRPAPIKPSATISNP